VRAGLAQGGADHFAGGRWGVQIEVSQPAVVGWRDRYRRGRYREGCPMSRVRVGRAPCTTADDILNKAKRQKTSLWPLAVVLMLNIPTMAPSRHAPQGFVLYWVKVSGLARGCRLFPSIELTGSNPRKCTAHDSCRYPLNAHKPPRTVEARTGSSPPKGINDLGPRPLGSAPTDPLCVANSAPS
jgi:hypothetical protein